VHKGMVKVPLEISIKEQYGPDMTECRCCKDKTINGCRCTALGNSLMMAERRL